MQISTTLALVLQEKKKKIVFDSAFLCPYSCFESPSLSRKHQKAQLKHS